MPTPLLETHDLVKDYVIGGEVLHAVNGVSLSIKRGEFVAIMGASGSGKSTIARDVLLTNVHAAVAQRSTQAGRKANEAGEVVVSIQASASELFELSLG